MTRRRNVHTMTRREGWTFGARRKGMAHWVTHGIAGFVHDGEEAEQVYVYADPEAPTHPHPDGDLPPRPIRVVLR